MAGTDHGTWTDPADEDGDGPRAPAARLTVRAESDQLLLSVEVPDRDRVVERGPLPLAAPGGLKVVQRDLRSALDEFKNYCDAPYQDGALPWTAVQKALTRLRTRGISFAEQVFGENGVFDISELLDEIGAGSRSADPGGRALELVSDPDTVLPLEFLPLMGLNNEPAPLVEGDYAGLLDNAARFVGFSFFVGRQLRGVPPGAAPPSRSGDRAVLSHAGRVRLQPFLYSGLRGATEEERQLATHGKLQVLAAQPRPDLDLSSELACEAAAASLADLIFAFDRSPGGVRSVGAPDLLHFACHAYTEPGENFTITLRAAADSPVDPVTLDFDHLDGASVRRRGRIRAKLQPDRDDLPFIFMNACGGSAIEPMTARSLPAFFLRKGFLGFVGTETVIDDEFALNFASDFYRRFLNGLPLGRALAEVRSAMLRLRRDPRGLLYTAYAYPGLHSTEEHDADRRSAGRLEESEVAG